MKIGIAQIHPEKGALSSNIAAHMEWVQRALPLKVDLIVFPELSLTGYEPELAQDLATDPFDTALHVFQQTSDRHHITIGVGLPTPVKSGIRISTVFFRPSQARLVYSKQILHPDEEAYFRPGTEQICLDFGHDRVAPAICYESMQPGHSAHAKALGANIYMVSVAKSEKGMTLTQAYFPELARRYGIPILMSNCVGPCNHNQTVGQSAIWDAQGTLKESLSKDREGLLVYDTLTQEVIKVENSDLIRQV